MFAKTSAGRTEYKEFYNSGQNVQLYHDASDGITAGSRGPLFTPLTGLPQGTANGQRVGDNIFVKEVGMRIWLSNKSDRPNVMYRVSVVILPGSSSLPGPATSVVFPNAGTNYITAYPDTTQYSVIYDKIVNKDMGSLTQYATASSLRERSYFHDVVIPFNATVSYSGTNTATAALYAFVTAYDAYGALAGDNIASFSYSTRIIYTDK
jgi:hypothetical protein